MREFISGFSLTTVRTVFFLLKSVLKILTFRHSASSEQSIATLKKPNGETSVRTVLWWWYVLGLENASSRDITLCRKDGWVQPRKRLHGWENACPRVGAWDWDELKQKTSGAREHSMFFFFFFLRYRAILCRKENKDSELSLFSNFLLELRVGGKTRGASFDF